MIKNFDGLRITLASPDQVMSWSNGEVKKHETINYRTHRAEVDGLMDERIFGPTKNYECYCGKYKKIRYKGIVCDQCGVEVTTKRVRRERMGHIALAAPVTHVWFAYGIPNKLSLILNIPQKKLETVIHYARYIVTNFDEEEKNTVLDNFATKRENTIKELNEEFDKFLDQLKNDYKEEIERIKKEEKENKKLSHVLQNLENKHKKELARTKSYYAQKQEKLKDKFDKIKTTIVNLKEGTTFTEEEYKQLVNYDLDFFDLGMGAEAIKTLLEKVDLAKEIEDLEEEIKNTRSVTKKRKFTQRIRVLKGMKRAEINPAWIVMDTLPVLPPDLRPIIQLAGGRFATSDLNDLYRRVINRNNRLKRLIKLGAPEVILRNEKRMLQESVDALIDNSHRPGNPVLNSREQAYKSLSDMLRGKQGRFRQNLLGKRVDYSGRSVVVAGPELKINQCGLPKTMALELFKPFILSEIINGGYAPNVKSAKLFYDTGAEEVWDILEKIITKHPVLLNRAPTLHKQGIQAFFPVLVEGNAIRLHPMVCKGFNADFDGDQMAVHVPLTKKAKTEIIERMFPKSNILLMADGSPVINAAKDMVLGIYYLTDLDKEKTLSKYFGNLIEVEGALELETITLQEPIKVLHEGSLLETTAGRIIFNNALPEEYEFINNVCDKKVIAKITADILDQYGSEVAIQVLDNFKTLGFQYATSSGISVSFEDFLIASEKDKIISDIEEKEEQFTQDYYMGLLTMEEKKRLVENEWMKAIDKIADITWDEYIKTPNNLVTINESGTIPLSNPLRQISGVKGLILDPNGKIVELPLKSNYKEGLSTLEYFVAARGTRKGLADTALKTAESGYLTRRLVDIAQDVIVREENCGTDEGVWLHRKSNRRLSLAERIEGRVSQEDIIHPETGEILVKQGEMITYKLSQIVGEVESIKKVYVRSPMTCKTIGGLCRKCYGKNLGTGLLVEKGIAVGIIAAQAMGEAATQLTLDTKHLAGRAGTDITQGLPRVEELFEVRTPKARAIISAIEGKVSIEKDDVQNEKRIKITNDKKTVKKYNLEDEDKASFKRSKKLKKSEVILTKKDGTEIRASKPGQAKLNNNVITVEFDEANEKIYTVPLNTIVVVEDGDIISKGDKITEGSIDPKELLEISGLDAAQEYIIDNIQQTYGIQGIALDDRHLEIIVKQMSRFVKITNPGDSEFLPGEFADSLEVNDINTKLKKDSKQLVKFEKQIFGLIVSSLKTESFLSAASFQEQVRVLTEAALLGKVDYLRGLKENVIIGRVVPLGDEIRD